MKKSFLLYIFIALLLVGCTTAQENDSKEVQGNTGQAEVEHTNDTKTTASNGASELSTLTLFKTDADYQYVEPYQLEYDGNEDELVRFIYEEVKTFEVELIDFTFENNEKSLVLNLGDGIYNVQGSAGGFLFAGTLVESYFANYPNLQQVTFIHHGSYEAILDHLMVGEPYTRTDAAFTNE
ncbi:fructose-2,6-bisphosphatase [Peribacillus asahii]|uniref:fructose-2,6-bisphosphatase n=1 Tax=Peribacillus asahii TaxID=228899 RepID=UPI00380BEE99